MIKEVLEHADEESKASIIKLLQEAKKKLAKMQHAGAKVLLKSL